jgi:transposase
MKNRDFRSLDNNTQAELRRLALLNLKKGKTVQFVAEMFDVHVQTVRDWRKKEKILESRNFQGEKRGRNEGDDRLITKEEEIKIRDTIIQKTPNEIGLGSSLWTRRVVHKLAKQITKQNLHLNTIGDYLHRWGMSAQRPSKIAYEQDKQKIEKWILEEYPKIEKQAKEEDAEICFGDESGVSLNTYYGKTYAPKGKTPKIKLPATRKHASMIASISNSGLSRFMIYKGSLDTQLFIQFLSKLIEERDRKIFLILDNLRVHKSKEVLSWVSKNENKISLFFPTTLRSTVQSCRIIKQYLKTRYTQGLFS